MIINFKCKNFYSVGDEEAVVNFAVDGNAPKTHLYQDVRDAGIRTSLIEAVIGPNASGKTTLLKVPAFLQHLIVTSLNDPIGRPLSYEPHKNYSHKPTEVSVKFSMQDQLFEYEFILSKQRILSERFIEYSKTEERFTAKTLFSREWDSKTKKYTLKDTVFNMSEDQLRENASMVAVAKQLPGNIFAHKIAMYWWTDVVSYNLWMRGHRESAIMDGGIIFTEIDLLLENPSLRRGVTDILKRYDIGFDEFVREEIKTLGDPIFMYGLKHAYNKASFSVPLGDESTGTKRLIAILTHIIRAMSIKHDGVAVIDELDAFLHPDIVEALVDLFVDEDTNVNKAQLLFSTHNHRVLTFLDKQQITLSEKNDKGESEVWRLDDVQGVRAGDNYYTKYTAGAYSAKPRIG